MEETYKDVIKEFDTLKRNKEWIANIDTEFFINFTEYLINRNKELEAELKPIKNIEKALDEMDIEGMWNDIKAEDYIPKSKIEKEFEKFTTHNNCFNLGDMQLLLDNILEED